MALEMTAQNPSEEEVVIVDGPSASPRGAAARYSPPKSSASVIEGVFVYDSFFLSTQGIH